MASSSTSQKSLPPSMRMRHRWPAEDRIEEAKAKRVKDSGPMWAPIPDSPQEQAFHSEADELFYGGAAGGGKTDLLLGVAGLSHYRSVIFRRVFPSARAIIERSREIYNAGGDTHAKDSFNEQLHLWRLASGRQVEFGAVQHEKNKEAQRGRPRDLYGFDEITEFSESIYRFVTAWNRSTHVDPVTKKPQRCRIIVTGNPPTSADGEWVIKYWGPWLDETHPDYPAPPGQLRWYARYKDEDVEIPADQVIEKDGKKYGPVEGKLLRVRSRTFIPAKLADNPYLIETDYDALLDSLPEPLRSQMKDGLFNVKREADPWQVIPTDWVKAAMERWKNGAQPDLPLGAMGVDVAHGGKAKTVISRRYGSWFAELLKYPGRMTDTGQAAAALVVQALDGSPVIPNIDANGVGASCVDALWDLEVPRNPVNVGNATGADVTDKSGVYRFLNLRAALYWMLREALDPRTSDLALPDDLELLADLCAPKYRVRGGKIQVESKDEILKRIQRSPDCGDAVLLAFAGELLIPAPEPQEEIVVYQNRVNISRY